LRKSGADQLQTGQLPGESKEKAMKENSQSLNKHLCGQEDHRPYVKGGTDTHGQREEGKKLKGLKDSGHKLRPKEHRRAGANHMMKYLRPTQGKKGKKPSLIARSY